MNKPNYASIQNLKYLQEVGYRESMQAGRQPNITVVKLTEYLEKESNILDIGAGPGANTIFLAEKGYTVTAQDVSSVAQEDLITALRERNISTVRMLLSDATQGFPVEVFDACVITFVLHLMTREDAVSTIRNAQNVTSHLGFNAIEVFTDGTNFVRTDRFYTTHSEILELYSQWKCLYQDTNNDTPLNGGMRTRARFLFQKY